MIKTVDNKQVFYRTDEPPLDYGSKVYSNTNNEHVKQTIFYAKSSKKDPNTKNREYVLVKDFEHTEPVSSNELIEAMLSGLIILQGINIILPQSLIVYTKANYSFVKIFNGYFMDFDKKEFYPIYDMYYSKEWLDIK